MDGEITFKAYIYRSAAELWRRRAPTARRVERVRGFGGVAASLKGGDDSVGDLNHAGHIRGAFEGSAADDGAALFVDYAEAEGPRIGMS